MMLNLRKVGGNTLSLLTSDVMNKATTFVLYALVARRLGAHEFGQLSLALSLFYLFQTFAVAGLKQLVVRQVAKDRTQTGTYFVNSCVLVAISSFVSLAVQFAFVRLMHYPPATSMVILALSLGLFPYALSAVCESIFQAWEKMHYIAYVNVPTNLAKVGLAFLLLNGNRGLYTIILILLGCLIAAAAIEVWIVLRRFPILHVSVSLPFLISTFRSALTFLGLAGGIAIEGNLNILFLSKLAGETQVGLYSAATQIMVPLVLLNISITESIFPIMCRKVEPGFQSLKRISVQVAEMLMMLALPTVAGLIFMGDWVLGLFYRKAAFLQAMPAVRIVAWILVVHALSMTLGQVLVAIHREKDVFRITVTNIFIILVLGWPLIKFFGLRGAAVSLLLTKTVAWIQIYVPVSRVFSGFPLAKILWKPFVAAACMAAYLAVSADQAGLLRGITATLIYGAALLALVIWTSGGLRQFREKYLFPLGVAPRQDL